MCKVCHGGNFQGGPLKKPDVALHAHCYSHCVYTLRACHIACLQVRVERKALGSVHCAEVVSARDNLQPFMQYMTTRTTPPPPL